MSRPLSTANAFPLLYARPAVGPWEDGSMLAAGSRLRSTEAKATLIGFLVVSLAVLTWLTPAHYVVLHNVLHHLNILPFMLAGMFFGWRGALKVIVLASVLQMPAIYRHWFDAQLDAEDQIVELSIFGCAGVIAGFLADRERLQRRRVEATKRELEQVYTELRQNIDRLKKSERLSAAGQLSASLAHEIRNPLASISGAAGILARGQASAESRAECLDILTKESQRLNKLLTNFLDFARPRLPRLQKTDPAEMVASATALAQHEARRREIRLELRAEASKQEVDCDSEQIKQLLLNLILNAIQASEAGARVFISSFVEGNNLCIDVRDSGRGVTPEDQEHIFDPFFTTRETGTGLGLAIAANIANQHAGSLTCWPNADLGMTFRLELPIRAAVRKPLPEEVLV